MGATIHSPPFTIASFSSRGPSGCGGAFAIKPEVSAPGVGIWSSVPGGGYQFQSGTSMAGPHVAGVVGLMRSANPDLDVQTVKQILMDTCMDLGPAGEENTYRHGFINAYEAVLASLTGYGSIEGTVTDAISGNPLEGVAVDVLSDPRATTTDEIGFFKVLLPAGTWTLEFSFFGYETESQPFDVVAQQITDGDFAMSLSSATDAVWSSGPPTQFELAVPRPNPFSKTTSIRFAVPEPGRRVAIAVFDVTGRRIRMLLDAPQAAGYHAVGWDGRDEEGHRVTSGVYFYRMESGSFDQVQSVAVLK